MPTEQTKSYENVMDDINDLFTTEGVSEDVGEACIKVLRQAYYDIEQLLLMGLPK